MTCGPPMHSIVIPLGLVRCIYEGTKYNVMLLGCFTQSLHVFMLNPVSAVQLIQYMQTLERGWVVELA